MLAITQLEGKAMADTVQQKSHSTTQLEVGDQLAFRRTHGSGWTIHKITRITPSGRIVCGPYTLNPDLSVRAAAYYGPYTGHLVTDAIRSEVTRDRRLKRLQSIVFDGLTDEQLTGILRIVGGEDQGQ